MASLIFGSSGLLKGRLATTFFVAASSSPSFVSCSGIVSELPLDVRAKLLRVLEEKRIERLGSPSSIAVDIRIIAASNQDLDAAQRAGTFRSDLFYRLNVFPITVPPLRERPEDIPLLVKAIVEELSATMAKRVDAIPRAQMNALVSYHGRGTSANCGTLWNAQ